jgi:CRP/FNR family transcriptional regulator, cyclic AMP receptor protein
MALSGPEALSQIPLFSRLSARQLRKLQRSAVEHTYEPDTTIVREGGQTATLFVLLEGSAKVVRKGRTISRREPGEYFGEISLIDGRPRAASVISETPVRCLILERDSLQELLRREPEVSWALLQSLATRLRGE